MSDGKNIPISGFVIAFAGAVFFSTKAIIVKLAFHHSHIDALSLLTIRMICSLPFFLIAAFVTSNRTGNVRINRKQWMYVITLGLFGYYLSSFFDFAGLQYISAGLERLILFLFPSFVLIINSVFFRQKVSGIQLLAVALTYIGIGMAYYGELHIDPDNAKFFFGSFLVFLCSVTYAVYIAGSGKIIPLIGANRFTAYAMLSATGGIFIHFMLSGNYSGVLMAGDSWIYGIVLALIATVIPTFMLSAALMRIGANNVAIISSIGPVSTILQAHWFLGEPIHGGQIVGTALVITGVLLTGWRSRKPATIP
jgi:drug/metabolite transporter (DMT)-like permease